MKMDLSSTLPINMCEASKFNKNNMANNNFNSNFNNNYYNNYYDIMAELEECSDFYDFEDYNCDLAHYNNNNNFDEDESEKLKSCKALVPISSQIQGMNSNRQLDPTTLRVTLRRNESFDRCFFQPNERKVLVIYTGGTIGMIRSKNGGLICAPKLLESTVRKFPHLHDEAYAKQRFGDAVGQDTPLVLPEIPGENLRVVYTIFEYDPLLDSSNMTADDWVRIGKSLEDNYDSFDGFVVLHGTDTMAYTASALSFMLENLGKSVVITGSQIPLFESRSDGRDNFLGALIMAGAYIIPEVTCYFGHRLFRGNRISKVSSDSLNAFDSPNMQPLATMGINIKVNYSSIFRPRSISSFQLNTCLNRNVGLLRLYPSITPEAVKVFLQPPTMGVVLQTYGSGNIPSNRTDLLQEFEEASKRGIIIVNCTQCGHGSVSAIYETGQKTVSAGIIPGHDLTPEAALTKLSYILGRSDWSLEKKREMVQYNMRGELTKVTKPSTISHHHLLASAKREFLADRERRISEGNELTPPNNNGIVGSPHNGSVGGLDVVNKIVRVVSASLRMSSPEEIDGFLEFLPALENLACVLFFQKNVDAQRLRKRSQSQSGHFNPTGIPQES